MDELPLIRDHRTLLQGRGVIGAEGCLGIRSSEGKSAPTQDDRKNKRKKEHVRLRLAGAGQLRRFRSKPEVYPLAIF